MGKSHGKPHDSHGVTGHSALGLLIKITVYAACQHSGQGSKTEELVDELTHSEIFTQMGPVGSKKLCAKKLSKYLSILGELFGGRGK